MDGKLVKNYLYSCVYQVLLILLPIITAPYLTRVLGSTLLGEYTYTYTIAYYFVMFSMLGLSNYGSRQIAMCDSSRNRKQCFHEIVSFQLCWSAVVIVLYVAFIVAIPSSYFALYAVQVCYVASALFDVSWYFFGREEFKVTVTRNIIVKAVATLSIFFLVRGGSDLLLYAFIVAGSTFVGNVAVFVIAIRNEGFSFAPFRFFKKHIRFVLVLFVPVLAVSIYSQLSKIILANMASVVDVTYYEYAYKIVSAPLGFITAFGSVMLPRMSSMLARGERQSINKMLSESFNFMGILALPLSMYLFLIAPVFAPLFYGEGFEACGVVMAVLALTIPFIAWGNAIRTQMLIPAGRNKEFVFSVIAGAVINIFLNLLLIPRFAVFGSAVATLVTEFAVCAIQFISVVGELPLATIIRDVLKTVVSVGVMSLAVMLLARFLSGWVWIIAGFGCGMVAYFLVLLVLKQEMRRLLFEKVGR